MLIFFYPCPYQWFDYASVILNQPLETLQCFRKLWSWSSIIIIQLGLRFDLALHKLEILWTYIELALSIYYKIKYMRTSPSRPHVGGSLLLKSIGIYGPALFLLILM